MTTFASVCSGVAGMDQGLERARLTPIWMCEIDQQCREVLRFHYPTLPIHRDMNALDVATLERPDVFCGGTPCQGFSVAGLRESLQDNRSNLCLQFVKLCNELDPSIILWENVGGVLSQTDNAFGCFLAGLVGADAPLVPPNSIRRWKVGKSGRYFSWPNAGMVAGSRRVASWRVLDTQFFDCPQRRERVFVVCDTGDFSSAKILFEHKSVQGNFEAREETREGITSTLSSRTSGGGGGSREATDPNQTILAIPFQPRIGRNGHSSDMAETGIVNALNSSATGASDAAPCVAIRTAQTSSNGCGIDESGTSYTLDGAQGQAVGSKYGVRRLMPVETEKLQGYPTGWTLKAISEKTGEVYEQTDSPRYKQCGNGVTATVAEWIGQRIALFLSQKSPINSEK